jgi:antitoxin CptB
VTEERRRERLRFRSWHRGTREMDLLLGSFADVHLEAFTDAQLDAYEEVLELCDADLYGWITGNESVPMDHDSDVMQILCAHRFVAKAV